MIGGQSPRLVRLAAIAFLLAAACGSPHSRQGDAAREATPIAAAANGKIAFAMDGDIYVVNPDGTGVTNLTKTEEIFESDPAWSPDGRRLAFVACQACTTSDLHVMNADGSGVTRITDDAALDGAPAWSPDGTRIAYHSDSTGQWSEEEGWISGNPDIWMVNADGTDKHRITDAPSHERGPVWSPDGSRIAFTSVVGGTIRISSVNIMNVDGSGRSSLTDSFLWAGSPVWSPDGSTIAFAVLNEDTKTSRAYAMNPDGTNVRRLMDKPEDIRGWSPDGTKFLFVGGGSHYGLHILDLATGATFRVYTAPQADGVYIKGVSWQPLPADASGDDETSPTPPDNESQPDEGPWDALPAGWSRLPPPPEVRSSTAATAWTGEQLLVWGGYVYSGDSDEIPQSDGFVFDAWARTWRPMTPSPLAARISPAAAWTGSEFLIWGGSDDRDLGGFFVDGAAYDPVADTWRTLPPAPISPRAPLYVWTGRELLVWGTSVRVEERPRDGAAYDPSSNSWRTIAEAPIELTDATAVWTGDEMIVFGAALHGGNFAESKTAIAAAYNPGTDVWRRLPDSGLSPQSSTAAWNGGELIAWDYLNGSAAYNPTIGKWRSLGPVPLDSGECGPTSVPVRNYVLGDKCGLMAVHDPADDEWHDVSRPELFTWGLTLVTADPAVLILGRNVDTGEEAMLAYRPPSW